MSEYHIIRADGSGTIASFDRWGDDVRNAWHAAARKWAVNLILMWPCGCLRRALAKEKTVMTPARFVKGKLRLGRKKTLHIHTGWRLVERCPKHARPSPK